LTVYIYKIFAKKGRFYLTHYDYMVPGFPVKEKILFFTMPLMLLEVCSWRLEGREGKASL